MGAVVNGIDFVGGVLEKLTDGNGNALGDIRLDRTKINGSLRWSIVETEFNHVTGELRGSVFTKEQVLLYLIKNKENFSDAQYREMARLLDIN
jgi:hypothetical protein